MQFYDKSGYLNFRKVRDIGMPFTLIIGGRGSGKTYGALKTSIEDDKIFAFMRRKQTQLDIINKPEFSPIKPVCRDTGWKYTMRPIAKGLSGFVPYEIGEDGKSEVISGPPVGYTCALSTIANLRGFDASEIDLLIYDEFIPEKAERPLQNEADALFNCYETFNRNRELQGRAPLQLICMANANDQTAPILESLRLIKRLDRMRKTGTEWYKDAQRGLALILLQDSPISAAKKETALYRLTSGTDYAEMALDNKFAYEDRGEGEIVSRPLTEYRPIVEVGEITIYKHKSNGMYYVSGHRMGTPQHFAATETDLARFRRSYQWLAAAHLDGYVEFEDFLCRVLLTKYVI